MGFISHHIMLLVIYIYKYVASVANTHTCMHLHIRILTFQTKNILKKPGVCMPGLIVRYVATYGLVIAIGSYCYDSFTYLQVATFQQV